MRESIVTCRTPILVGDWVRFYQLGQFTIAEVRYILPRKVGETCEYLCTEQGQITESQVLEVRHQVTP